MSYFEFILLLACIITLLGGGSMTKRAKLKILPLPWIYTSRYFRKEVSRGYHKETEPVFNRNGIYLLNKKCWLEVDGKAFEYDKDQFQAELQTLNHRCLSDSERECLTNLINHKMAAQEQVDLLVDDDNFMALKRASMSGKLEGLRMTRLIEAKMAKQ